MILKLKQKLLQFKCHILGLHKMKPKECFKRKNRVFAEAVFSHIKRSLFALEESWLPRMTYVCESQ
jgi:hypothetical protein